MSGICGWLTTSSIAKDPSEALLGMQKSLGRDPASSDTLLIENIGAAFSAFSGQGEVHSSEKLCLVYQGIPAWKDIHLQKQAASEGNGTVILKLYRDHGLKCLEMIHGTFCLAIMDRSNNSVLLATDRIGIRPLCYANYKSHFVFGSTADSVVRFPHMDNSISHQAIYHYLYYHMVPSPGSIYEQLSKLLPGQYVQFTNGSINKGFYWELPYKDSTEKSEDDLVSEFHGVLNQCVKNSADNMHKLGAFLSGGTDSSTVTGGLTRVFGEGINTYSMGFDAEGYDETEYARITAKHFKSNHHEYFVTPDDVADAIPLVAGVYDEPFGNASAIPTYCCARFARNDGIDTLLAGDGGDEIFAGNERYAKQLIFEKYSSIPEVIRKVLIEPVFLGIPGVNSLPVIRKISSYVSQASTPLPDRLEAYNFLHRTALEEIFEPDFLSGIDADMPLQINRDAYTRTQSGSHINRMMHLDMKNTLADNDLRKVSRMCELAGIDVRYPLLDEQMVEFAGKVPADIKLKNGKLRYFFKYAVRDLLPEATLTKSKHGFGLPFGLWMRENPRLQELAHDSLADMTKKKYVRPEYIDYILKQHNTGHASYYGVMVWVMMMLSQWFDTHDI